MMRNKKKEVKHYYLYYDPEFIKEILVMYLKGMPINSISVYAGMSPDEINFILDHYAPYLG